MGAGHGNDTMRPLYRIQMSVDGVFGLSGAIAIIALLLNVAKRTAHIGFYVCALFDNPNADSQFAT